MTFNSSIATIKFRETPCTIELSEQQFWSDHYFLAFFIVNPHILSPNKNMNIYYQCIIK